MGAAARRRAREHYDWSVILRHYRALWGELAALRRSGEEVAKRRPGTPAMPPLDDPFRVFAGFASAPLGDDDLLYSDDDCLPLTAVLSSDANTYMLNLILPGPALTELTQRLRAGPVSVASLTRGHPQARRIRLGMLWLLKFGVARRLR